MKANACEPPDHRDLAAAKAGDHAAFARLYDRHAPVVLSLCRGSISGARRGTPADAEDATQETFMRAHRKLDQVDDAAGFRSWLFAIARRVCAERRRAAVRRSYHEHGASGPGCVSLNGTASQAAAASDADRAESLARLTAAIEKLDERERLAVHLYYLDADPVRAAAETLQLSRSAYYKLLARARERLAVIMQEVPTP